MKALRFSFVVIIIIVIITISVIFYETRFNDRSLNNFVGYKNVPDNISYSEFIERYGEPYKEVKNSAYSLDFIFYDLYKTDNYKIDENANKTCLFYDVSDKYAFGFEFDSITNKLIYKACIRLDLSDEDFKKLSLGYSRNKVLDILKHQHRILGSGFTYYGYKLADGSCYTLLFQEDKLVNIGDGSELWGTY